MISGDFNGRQFFGHKFMAQNIQLRPGFLIPNLWTNIIQPLFGRQGHHIEVVVKIFN